MKPYISIIIPVYRVEEYIRECLDSVLNWRFTNWEAILIDDGTPDGSAAICDEYAGKDSRFKVIHKENEGVSMARNAGLDMAQGEWCWFVDSDDVINTRLIVDEQLLKGKDIVMFDILPFNHGERIPEQNGTGETEECTDLNTFYLKNISWAHPTLWYHRKFWAKGGEFVIRFSKQIRLGEDIEFMRKCELLSTDPLKVDFVNYYYRQRCGSVMHDSDRMTNTVEDVSIVLENIYNFVVNNKIESNQWKIYRVATIAKVIPTHAVKAGIWNQIYDDYKTLIRKYVDYGYTLQSDRLIYLSVRYPVIFQIVYKLLTKIWAKK